MTNTQYDAARSELLARLREIDDLSAAADILHWDQATYMPPGGAAARSPIRHAAHPCP